MRITLLRGAVLAVLQDIIIIAEQPFQPLIQTTGAEIDIYRITGLKAYFKAGTGRGLQIVQHPMQRHPFIMKIPAPVGKLRACRHLRDEQNKTQ